MNHRVRLAFEMQVAQELANGDPIRFSRGEDRPGAPDRETQCLKRRQIQVDEMAVLLIAKRKIRCEKIVGALFQNTAASRPSGRRPESHAQRRVREASEL